jgi:ribosomal protein S21
MNKTRDERIISGLRVEVRGDDFNRALRTFSKKVQDNGKLKEIKERMEYEPQSVRRQRMIKQARKRWEREVEDLIAEAKWPANKPY